MPGLIISKMKAGAGSMQSRHSTLEIKRTPDVLENEFVTIITITTLLLGLGVAIVGTIDSDEIDEFCKTSKHEGYAGTKNGICITKIVINVPAYLSAWSAGAGFFMSMMLLLAYRWKNILPSDQELANIYYDQFRQEIYLSYTFTTLSMIFMLVCGGGFIYFKYPHELLIGLNYVGMIYLTGAFLWMVYQYRIFDASTIEVGADMQKLQSALEALDCAKYAKRFSASKISFEQLFELTVDEMVTYLSIPLGDAKRIQAGLEKADQREKVLRHIPWTHEPEILS